MKDLKLDTEVVDKTGFNPYYPRLQSALGDQITIDEGEFINLAANNYLGLADDSRVKKQAVEAVNTYGTSMCGTPIATGYIELYQEVEAELADFVGTDDCLILPSCYQANNGLFPAILEPEDVVFADHFAHSSLLEGIKSAPGELKPFLHNNLDHLEKLLNRQATTGQKLIVTESVFSTEGSIAPLAEIMKLCDEYNALPVIDDSHGLGVLGEEGRGILEAAEVEDFSGIYTASLGKALANSGGIICGDQETIDYLRYHLSHLIYSTALPPAVLGGIKAVLQIIRQEFAELSDRLWKYKAQIEAALVEAGFEVIDSEAPINSIKGGSAEATVLIAKQFYEQGVLTTPFIEPSVPPNKGKVRLIAGANLSQSTIERAVEIITELDATRE